MYKYSSGNAASPFLSAAAGGGRHVAASEFDNKEGGQTRRLAFECLRAAPRRSEATPRHNLLNDKPIRLVAAYVRKGAHAFWRLHTRRRGFVFFLFFFQKAWAFEKVILLHTQKRNYYARKNSKLLVCAFFALFNGRTVTL